MADDPRTEALVGIVENLKLLTAIALENVAYVHALHAYLEAQPGYNAHLWKQLLEKYRTQGLEGYQRDAQKALDAAQAALRDFEGPPQ
jgi:hypothetical protein